MKPFLKWAGGKRWLVSAELVEIPIDCSRYIEPFIGSGALFFALNPEKAVIGDLNSELITTYKAIRDYPDVVWTKLKRHASAHNDDYYYEVRNSNPSSDTGKAARMIYLNRTCFNGLYRVNLKGRFNVPRGTKDSVVFDDDNFLAISARLRNVEIFDSDFESVLDEAGSSDFVYIDPPYTVKHNQNSFVKYNEKIFSWRDQERLKNKAEEIVGRGAKVVVSNADHEAIRELYCSDLWRLESVPRRSTLCSSPSRRGMTTELVVRSRG